MRLFKATTKDVPRIMECAREFTSVLPECKLSEEHYTQFWINAMNCGIGGMFLLEHDGCIVGGIGGIKSNDQLTGLPHAVELFWYVKPEHRQGLWPIKLLKEFEKWAKENQCAHVCMIYMQDSQPEKMKSFYERSGYSLLETVYRKKI